MARHRDIRNMDYEDEYDGYDDIYGHSVEDDYYISPSNRQFIYNRDNSRESRFEHEDDIQEVDEIDELSDSDKAKLNSCLDEVKNTLGPTRVPRSELISLILKYKFNIELIINAILENSKYDEVSTPTKDKDLTKLISNNISSSPNGFVIPNIFGKTPLNSNIVQADRKGNQSSPKGFEIPKIFNNLPQVNNSPKKFSIPNIFGSQANSINSSPVSGSPNTNFTVPKIFGSNLSGSSPKISNFIIPKLGNNLSKKTTEDSYGTLSELVSSHLKNTLPEQTIQSVSKQMSDITLSDRQNMCSNDNENDFNIDLSKALKVTVSLPNVSKNKDVTEKFDIPFIDGDLYMKQGPKPTLTKRKPLPCTLNIRHIFDIKVNMKKPSRLGKVLSRKYKHHRANKIDPHLTLRCSNTLKVFSFNTQSPDDYISSHLKR